MARRKKVVEAPAPEPSLDIIKLEPEKVPTVTFKCVGGNGWRVFASGTDDPHEAIHMVMAISEAVTHTLPPICAMFEATKQPDGSWCVSAAEPDKVLERLFAAMQREGR